MGSEDQLRSELSLLTDEYKALKAEIVSNLVSARQVSGLAFAGIGALIAGGRFLVESEQPIFFLVTPVFFYALAWAQLRYVFLVLDMGAHLRCVVAPRVRQLLAALSDSGERTFDHVFSWEDLGKSPVRCRSNRLLKLLFIPIAGANFGIPLLAAASSVVAFFVFHQSDVAMSSSELTLLCLNVFALVYSAACGLAAEQMR
jgi:hypothetical protein